MVVFFIGVNSCDLSYVNNVGAIYITNSQFAVNNIIERSCNSSNIIRFQITYPINTAEELYKIKELNLRALMDNGKIFVIQYDQVNSTSDDITRMNKLILDNIIEHAFARIDGKEYDSNHDLIDKNLTYIGGLRRKPFFVYIEDCLEYLNKNLVVALMEIRLKKVGIIFGLTSDGKIDNSNQRIDALLANIGSLVLLKSNITDINTTDITNKSTWNIKTDLTSLKQNECVTRIMKQGLKSKEAKILLDYS